MHRTGMQACVTLRRRGTAVASPWRHCSRQRNLRRAAQFPQPAPTASPFHAGGEVTAWSFSLWNSAKNFAFIQNRAFTPSDGDGTATDPYIATLTIPSIPDGLYTVTVAATTATGTNSSLWSPPVALGTPPAPSIVGATGSDQAVTLSIRVAQAVTVPANAAAGIRSGTTAASQPTFFTVTLRWGAGKSQGCHLAGLGCS